MQNLDQLIRESMKKEGIDLIGFASRERFATVDAQHNPFSIFPEGKTVIMLGKRICRGSLRGVEEGEPTYREADRLASILATVSEAPSEGIPADSILRETIGGSQFSYV